MMMCGGPLNGLRQNTVCLVQVWQNAVAWTQRHSTKANAGPKKGNHDGRQRTAYPRYYRQRVPESRILPSL